MCATPATSCTSTTSTLKLIKPSVHPVHVIARGIVVMFESIRLSSSARVPQPALIRNARAADVSTNGFRQRDVDVEEEVLTRRRTAALDRPRRQPSAFTHAKHPHACTRAQSLSTHTRCSPVMGSASRLNSFRSQWMRPWSARRRATSRAWPYTTAAAGGKKKKK